MTAAAPALIAELLEAHGRTLAEADRLWSQMLRLTEGTPPELFAAGLAGWRYCGAGGGGGGPSTVGITNGKQRAGGSGVTPEEALADAIAKALS